MTSTAPQTTLAAPSQRFIFRNGNRECDLTELIVSGAKLTVLFSQVCHDWHLSYNLKRAEYAALRRQCKRWESENRIEYLTDAYHSLFIGVGQRPGIFVRACGTTAPLIPNLIRGLQNSKSSTAAKFERLSENEWEQIDPEPEQTQLPDTPEYRFPGGKLSWLRIQAIRRCMEIDDPALFIRETTKDGRKVLNRELVKKQDMMCKLFNTWKAECLQKNIVLRNTRPQSSGSAPPYLKLDYKTRFTDIGRHIENEQTYKNAIAKSLEKYKTGVFITLTTDPQIAMNPKGEKFERYVKDDKHTHRFEVVGKGGNLWSANRSESNAWRSWYETQCHRYGFRIPYIRVVEFQKNGLIHTHILLFDIEWNSSWKKLAQEWGEQYGQGLMNKVYRIKNVDNCWHWAVKGEQPDDSKGRNPADYLMKYLKKAQSAPTVRCPVCGQLHESTGEMITCSCGHKMKPPTDYRYMYWICGKRFFTISQCLRVPDFDKEIEKEERRERNAGLWEFIGAPYASDSEKLIEREQRKHQPPSKIDDNEFEKRFEPQNWIAPHLLTGDENPDIDEDADAIAAAVEKLKEKERQREQIEKPVEDWNLADFF